MLITQAAEDVTLRCLSDAQRGFNAQMATAANQHKVDTITIDWTPGLQFHPFNGTPDDMEQEDNPKYPMVFMYGFQTFNRHEMKGRTFSGSVQVALSIWITSKASRVTKAGPELQRKCNALEAALHAMFADGNWPQYFGLRGAVQAQLACTHLPLQSEGEGYRQGVQCTLPITLDTN